MEVVGNNKMLKQCYDMLREYYYEKNGIENTIEFLKVIINELEIIKSEQTRSN